METHHTTADADPASPRDFQGVDEAFDRGEAIVTPSDVATMIDAAARGEGPRDVSEIFPLFFGMVERQSDLTCVYRPSGEVVYTNRSFARFYGRRRSELIGSPLVDLAPVEHRAAAEEALERAASLRPEDGTLSNLVEMSGASGERTWVEWHDAPLFDDDGAPIVIVAIGRDQTARHLAEVQLREANRRLEESNRDLADFAYIASHDLQEPLRKISTFADRLGQRAAGELSERNLDYLDRINNASLRMQRLVDDLLTFSRVSTQGRPSTTCDLDQVCRGVMQDLEVAVELAGAKVDVGPLPPVLADPTQMHQLLQNLLANGLKFTDPNRRPELTVVGRVLPPGDVPSELSGSDPDRSWVRIVVADNGIGFDAADAEKIFAVFHRLHGRSSYEGSGIGLSVCRRIIERHGGRIRASGSPGVGAEFEILLPA